MSLDVLVPKILFFPKYETHLFNYFPFLFHVLRIIFSIELFLDLYFSSTTNSEYLYEVATYETENWP